MERRAIPPLREPTSRGASAGPAIRTGDLTDSFVRASAACWDLYQRLSRPASAQQDTARERRLMQDAYAAQHPGVPQRRSVQSVAVHLMDLCLLLERGGEVRRLVPVLGRMPPRRTLDLRWLEPPEVRGTMTVADALQPDAGELRAAHVEAWAGEVWAAWEPHHATVRGRPLARMAEPVSHLPARRGALAEHRPRSHHDDMLPTGSSVGDAPGTSYERRSPMASNAKKKTTMAKIARENAVRERRLRKEDRKKARKEAAAANASGTGDQLPGAPVPHDD